MATPTCPKCPNTTFEMVQLTPHGANHKHNFIICSSCGCIVGTHEFYNIGASLFDEHPTLNERFAKVETKLSSLESVVRSLQR